MSCLKLKTDLEVSVWQYRCRRAKILDLCELWHEFGPGYASSLVDQLNWRTFTIVGHAVPHQHVEFVIIIFNCQNHGHRLTNLHQAGHFSSPRPFTCELARRNVRSDQMDPQSIVINWHLPTWICIQHPTLSPAKSARTTSSMSTGNGRNVTDFSYWSCHVHRSFRAWSHTSCTLIANNYIRGKCVTGILMK